MRNIWSYWILFVFLMLGTGTTSYAQKTLREQEQVLMELFESMGQATVDSVRFDFNEKICHGIRAALSVDSSFFYPFAELGRMGKINSPDGSVRLYSWNLMLEDGTNRYYGFLQRKNRKQVETIELLNGVGKYGKQVPDGGISRDWLGGLYYQIVPFRSKRSDYYMLLGWDGNDHRTTRKLIEILHFNRKGEPVFGAPLIQWKNKRLQRVVFEFAKQARMTLRYDSGEHRVVFDHLSPSSSRYRGQYVYYGPDFSHDALVFEKGIWKLVENVDARNAEIRKK